MFTEKVYDLVGVGFGPSNIALAITLEELQPDIDYVFLERRAGGYWQEEMLLHGSDIQNNPIRDLVTLRNPQSRYTFINYLKQVGRLLDYLNLDLHYPLRKDYARYIAWVAEHFHDHVEYQSDVETIEFFDDPSSGAMLWRLATSDGAERFARSLVFGPGRQPCLPDAFRPHLGPRVFHLAEYLRRISLLAPSKAHVAVVGASQSAVEILLDLMKRDDDLRISAIYRSFSFRLKDTSPFSNHVYFPDFIDYFYNAPLGSRMQLEEQLRPTNYSSVDGDALHELYLRLYEEKLDGRQRLTLRNNTVVDSVQETDDRVVLETREVHTGHTDTFDVDAVVLATGFLNFGVGSEHESYHPLLAEVMPALATDDRGVIRVERDYSVPTTVGPAAPLLYLNGLCESTHGLGDAGSFSLVSLRAAAIANSLLPRLSGGASDHDQLVRERIST